MKCTCCQYEYLEDWSRDVGEIIVNGDEPFITIHGTFLVENNYSWNKGKHEIHLYACPKCQTVRIND